ncbi:hypothetical protein KDA14_04720 [Candidatus Saccharibacteria bacterium]|nr:hypothetical protein [Candidatus Saccharibacteria bacterium]
MESLSVEKAGDRVYEGSVSDKYDTTPRSLKDLRTVTRQERGGGGGGGNATMMDTDIESESRGAVVSSDGSMDNNTNGSRLIFSERCGKLGIVDAREVLGVHDLKTLLEMDGGSGATVRVTAFV